MLLYQLHLFDSDSSVGVLYPFIFKYLAQISSPFFTFSYIIQFLFPLIWYALYLKSFTMNRWQTIFSYFLYMFCCSISLCFANLYSGVYFIIFYHEESLLYFCNYWCGGYWKRFSISFFMHLGKSNEILSFPSINTNSGKARPDYSFL